MGVIQVKRNDLLPAVVAVLTNAAGTAVDLTAASGVVFKMRLKPGSGDFKVNAAGTISDAANGEVTYAWTGTDTDTANRYYVEWEVTTSGQTQTYPTVGFDYCIVWGDLDG